jgi:endonuclease YncB( thermonuclease family)
MERRLLSLCILLCVGCTTIKNKGYGNARVSNVVRVCDGDTFVANIEGYRPLIGKKIRIRIRGINTPELRSPDPVERQKAIEAKERLSRLLKTANRIELRNITRGKYFRIIADVYIGEKNIVNKLRKD